MDRSRDRAAAAIIALGAALFTAGLLTGFLIPIVTNPRMGLSAHLEGVANGAFLIAVGAVWHRLRLPPRAERLSFWLLVYGSVANWVFVLLGAVFGASRAMPIASTGYSALAWQDTLVTAGLASVGLTMVLSMLLVTWGFVRSYRQVVMG
jgi:(hydroxyamino)benzene mutase